MSILLSHPTGNQNSRQAALAFAERSCLKLFATALTIKERSVLMKLAPRRIADELLRRSFNEIGEYAIGVAEFSELLRLLLGRAGSIGRFAAGRHWIGIDKICGAVDKEVANMLLRNRVKIRSVYAYEDAALDTFTAAKKIGARCIYELPIGHWAEQRQLNYQERLASSSWGNTWKSMEDSEEKLRRKDEELIAAELVIVASSYTYRTLRHLPDIQSKTIIVPYGCPPTIQAESRIWSSNGEPLRVLYVGGLSQRKGLSYLAEAAAFMGGKIQLTVVGSGPAEALLRCKLPDATFISSLPNLKILNYMRNNDVLLFPSLFEGFGMVITEALSQGMIVIATDRTALPDIADTRCSFCVMPGDSNAIIRALETLYGDRDLLREMGMEALRCSARNQWVTYRHKLVSMVGAD